MTGLRRLSGVSLAWGAIWLTVWMLPRAILVVTVLWVMVASLRRQTVA